MTNDIVIHPATIDSLIGWVVQMWPILAGMSGGFLGVLRYVYHKHRKCEIELHDNKKRVLTLEGQMDILVKLLGFKPAEIFPEGEI